MPFSNQALKKAASHLTETYRSSNTRRSDIVLPTQEKLAYLSIRLPATFSAISYGLTLLHQKYPSFSPHSLWDMGAGPGTASWAASQIFHTLFKYRFLEKDPEWICIGKTLGQNGPEPLKEGSWHAENLANLSSPQMPSDLVIAAYALNEVDAPDLPLAAEALWNSTSHVLLLIEPGSRQGFQTVRQIRDFLIKKGASIIAPCPHIYECPLLENNWCHFDQHVERSLRHRHIKNASLAYETEKFSYIVAARHPLEAATAPSSRLIAAPLRRSGHTQLDICTPEGTHTKLTMSRRQKVLYQLAKKVKWGEEWPSSKDGGV